jgi:curved DNA-binding protein CbpA
MIDYYNVLQVPPDASPELIRTAYRREAKRWHPDSHPHLRGAERDALQRRFILLAQAYDTLGDVHRRREYDRLRTARGPDPGTVGPRPSPGQGRARASRARPAQEAAPAADWDSLLRDVGTLLNRFGLDLKQPGERLIETLLDWARELFREFLAKWREESETRRSTPREADAGPKARSRAGPEPRQATKTQRPRDRLATPEIEAELAELKRQAAKADDRGPRPSSRHGR